MPVPKAVRRAAREGGNVGKVPAGTPEGTPEPEAGVSKIRGMPGSKQAANEATRDLFILEVKTSNLKENKRGPYRSVTGVAADGKYYWAPLDASHKPEKEQIITLRGENKGSFGGEGGKPKLHKILGPNYFPDVVSISDSLPSDEPVQEPLKFEDGDAEALQKTLEPLVKQHGIGKILTVLGEIT